MAKTATLQINLQVTGDGVNENDVPVLVVQPNAAGGRSPGIVFQTGDNTIGNFSSTQSATLLLVPPSNSTVAKKLKGVGGDTGVALDPTREILITIPASGSVIINCSSPEVIPYWQN